jgi:hypothetical protein
MRTIIFISLLFMVSCSNREVIADDEFIDDIDYLNMRIWGILAADTTYKFSRLTFAAYLELLQQNEMISGKGVTEKVKQADKYCFHCDDEGFVVTLYYRTEQTVISDNAEQGKKDTIFYFYAVPSDELLRLISERMINR